MQYVDHYLDWIVLAITKWKRLSLAVFNTGHKPKPVIFDVTIVQQAPPLCCAEFDAVCGSLFGLDGISNDQVKTSRVGGL